MFCYCIFFLRNLSSQDSYSEKRAHAHMLFSYPNHHNISAKNIHQSSRPKFNRTHRSIFLKKDTKNRNMLVSQANIAPSTLFLIAFLVLCQLTFLCIELSRCRLTFLCIELSRCRGQVT
jgi:hypothetical protein